jgi:hypothetical protein
MKMLFRNNATSFLAYDTDAASASFTVLTGDGAKFPVPSGDGSDAFPVTLEDRRTGQMEICLCTVRSGDTFEITRGQEGTGAQSFKRGTTVSNRLTAKVLADFQVANVSTAETPPTSPVPGQMWWDSSSGDLYIYYDDGSSVQWVQVNLNGIEEAPNDGTVYGRKNFLWVPAPNDPASIPDAYTKTESDAKYVDVAGDTVTGVLLVPAPADLNQVVPRVYVDNSIASVNVSVSAIASHVNALDTEIDSKEPAITAGDPTYVWWGNKTWAPIVFPVNEAPTDGQFYLRRGSTHDWYAGLALSGGTLTGTLSGTSISLSAGISAKTGNFSTNVAYPNYALIGQTTGNGGGVLGYSGSSYGILGYNLNYSLYGNATIYTSSNLQILGTSTLTGNVAMAGQLNVDGYVVTTLGGSDVQTATANTVMTSGGTIRRTTSSMYYKNQIEKLEPEFADLVLKLKTVFYRPGENTSEPQDWSRFGFIAEDAFATDFRFANCEVEAPTKPIIHDLNAIVACLLDVVRRQGDRIAALEAR